MLQAAGRNSNNLSVLGLFHGSGFAQGVLDGIDDAHRGLGRVGHNVDVSAVGSNDATGDFVDSGLSDRRGIAALINSNVGDLVAFDSHGDSDGALEALGLAGQFLSHGGDGQKHHDSQSQCKNSAHGGVLL